jgi:6-phosphofructokinase 1
MKTLAVLTSGGDAPGMNAAIRSIVRVGTSRGLAVIGIQRGYQGLLDDEFGPLGPRDVSNVIQHGGTILHTSRCEEFKTAAGLRKAKKRLEQRHIDGVVLIGGDGTFRGGEELGRVWPGQLIGVPATIDNDVNGTECTIGYDTAVNTAIEAIDKIRDTAESHERSFLVEVMGRHAGYIALGVGIGAGAEEILLPERPYEARKIYERLCAAWARGKTSSILVVAEGAGPGGATKLAEELRKTGGKEYRVVILGHLQRGGSPSAADRILATKLGACAVDLFLQGRTGVMAGMVGGQLCATAFRDTFSRKKPLDEFLLDRQDELSS